MVPWQAHLSLIGACVLAAGGGFGGVAWGVWFGQHHPAAIRVTPVVTRTVARPGSVRVVTATATVRVPAPAVTAWRTRYIPGPVVTRYITRDVYPAQQHTASPPPAATPDQGPSPQPDLSPWPFEGSG